MKHKKTENLGDQQLRILQALWSLGEATVADVQTQLADGSAYTTVATMLRKLEERGLVTHHRKGRKFVFQAAVAPEEVSHGLTSRLVDRLFAGSLAGAVNHLLQSREFDPDELDELERLVQEHRQRNASKNSTSLHRKGR